VAAIGVLTLEIRVENSHSLKDKRHVVKSLKDRLRHKFNVSVAEIDHAHGELVLQTVEKEAAELLGPQLVSATVEWMS
jgi:uncharacterized protein YlxP (DUF503 family)